MNNYLQRPEGTPMVISNQDAVYLQPIINHTSGELRDILRNQREKILHLVGSAALDECFKVGLLNMGETEKTFLDQARQDHPERLI